MKDMEVKDDKWVYDSSLDHKGNIPLRASTGTWKASLFIIAIEFSERLSYFGIATSLIIYLTKVLDQDLKTAAKSVNNWIGVTTVMPLLGGFIADAFLGRFSTVLLSSIVYIAGLTLLTLSRFVPALMPCKEKACQETRKIHEIVFFIAIYLISVGTGGHKPSLESFGADQFDEHHDQERRKKMSFFNWWNLGLCCGLFLGVTVIMYVQDHIGWGTADVILAVVMILSLVIFLVGTPYYRYRKPRGSPLTPMLQVIVGAVKKRNLPYAEMYEVSVSQKNHGRLLCHTPNLKFLDKAAMVADNEIPTEKQSPWKLATVTKVEEAKLIINLIPIWLSTLPFGIVVAQSATFFIKQATMFDRHITHDFIMPPASTYSLAALGMITSVIIYEKLLVPVLRRVIIGNERGITILQRIGIGMSFSIAAMVTAALVEKKRLHLVAANPETETDPPTLSFLWLAPQFLIIGFGDGFAIVGLQEFFYDQVPDSMRSLGIAFYLSVIGAANFLSSLLITGINRVTSKNGHSWFGKDLNSSRLDKFYWLLAAMMVVSICIYAYLARRYTYKSVQPPTVVDCYEDDGATKSIA